MSSKLRLAGDFDFRQLAKLTPGFVGADLQSLTVSFLSNGVIRSCVVFYTLFFAPLFAPSFFPRVSRI